MNGHGRVRGEDCTTLSHAKRFARPKVGDEETRAARAANAVLQLVP